MQHGSTIREHIPPELRRKVIRKQQGECLVCGMYCPPIAEFHHRTRVADGGATDERNLVMVCPNCHACIHQLTQRDPSTTEAVYRWLLNSKPIEQVNLLLELAHCVVTRGR